MLGLLIHRKHCSTTSATLSSEKLTARWIIFCVVEMLKRSRKHGVRIGGAFRGWMDLTRSKRLVLSELLMTLLSGR